jgi:hypothetical protein
MKQLGILSNSNATIEEKKMLADYWEVIKGNSTETFLFSDSEFFNKYNTENYFSNLRTLEAFTIYQVKQCSVCFKPFKVVINDRTHLKSYTKSKNKCCRACGHFDSSFKNLNTK